MPSHKVLSLFFLVFNSALARSSMYSKEANEKSGNCFNDKQASLEQFKIDMSEPGGGMTTNQGIKISDNQNSLKAGPRGPTLLEDFLLREKITHFDHERIPERVVHARGTGAFGEFQPYQSWANITKAAFLQDAKIKTPVFVRFSTVQGSRGSADTVRDVRGFATKFYTQEGNFDLVGNNMPVFFIQDAIKFPDIIHAVKPEHDNEMPQASSAHDTFWDFVAEQTETLHHVMWLMSDRALPRSFSMMEGFGVNTFRLVNAEGVSRFVKFHWKPLLGVHSLVWDETQKIAGRDPDYNRRDLWDNINAGNFFEYELGFQIVDEAMVDQFDFDILDATKLIPEELVPVTKIGKMSLNRNVEYFFAETEQVAYCISNIVPGIDFSNDPLLQGRLFSYLDTQITRLGGPNFHEIPINRPLCPFHPRNNNRDGFHRQTINVGKANYDINSINKGLPKEVGEGKGFSSVPEKMSGAKVRERSQSFGEHFAQATMFWKSMSAVEQDHIVLAFSFELGKVMNVAIREKVVGHLQAIDPVLAQRVATNLGIQLGPNPHPGYPRDVTPSPSLSQENTPKNSIKGRMVAVLTADGVDEASVTDMKTLLEGQGAMVKIIGPHLGPLRLLGGGMGLTVDGTFLTMPDVMFDAVYVPGGDAAVRALLQDGQAIHYVLEAFIHFKPIAASGEGVSFLKKIGIMSDNGGAESIPAGVAIHPSDSPSSEFQQVFKDNIAKHRFWNRPRAALIPA